MSYIERRRNLWYATLTIPKGIRHLLGNRAKFIKSTGCSDKGQAQIVALQLVAGWKKQIESVRSGKLSVDVVHALNWKEALQNDDDGVLDEVATDWIEERVNAGIVPPEKGRELADIVYGRTVYLAAILPEWEASLLANKEKPRSYSQKVSAGREVAAYFTTSEQVSPKAVREWAKHLIDKGLSVSSISRRFNAARSIWMFLQDKELVDDAIMPFVLPPFVTEIQKTTDEPNRVHFTPEQIVRVRNAACDKGDGQLADLISLAMYTGARIEELCSLRVADCSESVLIVSRTKTKNGRREIPVHSAIRELVARLLKESEDGYLMSGLVAPKSSNERSSAIGKRFGRLKTSMGFSAEYVFHSIRKTVCTLLENAGIPEGVAADIVGHKKRTMTYGLYSGGSELEIKRAAIERLSYPE